MGHMLGVPFPLRVSVSSDSGGAGWSCKYSNFLGMAHSLEAPAQHLRGEWVGWASTYILRAGARGPPRPHVMLHGGALERGMRERELPAPVLRGPRRRRREQRSREWGWKALRSRAMGNISPSAFTVFTVCKGREGSAGVVTLPCVRDGMYPTPALHTHALQPWLPRCRAGGVAGGGEGQGRADCLPHGHGEQIAGGSGVVAWGFLLHGEAWRGVREGWPAGFSRLAGWLAVG